MERLDEKKDRVRICKNGTLVQAVDEIGPMFDKDGHPVMIIERCGIPLIRTVLSENPKILNFCCPRCGYGYNVKNGLQFPQSKIGDQI